MELLPVEVPVLFKFLEHILLQDFLESHVCQLYVSSGLSFGLYLGTDGLTYGNGTEAYFGLCKINGKVLQPTITSFGVNAPVFHCRVHQCDGFLFIGFLLLRLKGRYTFLQCLFSLLSVAFSACRLSRRVIRSCTASRIAWSDAESDNFNICVK